MSLVDMGYTKAEASIAIERCGAHSRDVYLLMSEIPVPISFVNYFEVNSFFDVMHILQNS